MKKIDFIYPAVFVKDENDSYQVFFTDLNIYTDGKNLDEAYMNAKDLLLSYFTYAVKYEIDVYKPSSVEQLSKRCRPGELVMLVDALVEF